MVQKEGRSMLKSKKNIALVIGIIILMLIAGFAFTKKISPIGLKLWGDINNSQGVAVGGYDVVAYQTQNSANLGEEAFSVSLHGIQWHFSSQEHKILFERSPEKYLPQYGGYCSFAVSKGVTANTNPDVWHVEDEKLYFFMDDGVKKDWLENNGIAASDKNWTE